MVRITLRTPNTTSIVYRTIRAVVKRFTGLTLTAMQSRNIFCRADHTAKIGTGKVAIKKIDTCDDPIVTILKSAPICKSF